MKSTSADEASRFSAKLLFQFRVSADGVSNIMRLCEERIVVIRANSAKKALSLAKGRGKKSQHNYKNDAGGTVHFEFVGVLDLLRLGPECAEDEVWYDITRLKLPMERSASIIPPECRLNAIRNNGL